MPEIQAKMFPLIDLHCFPLSIDKIKWSLTLFIDFDFYVLATPESNYVQAELTFFWNGGRSYREELGIYQPGQYRPSEKTLNRALKESQKKKKKNDAKLFDP